MSQRKKNIVVMGGGTGTFGVLSGLRDSGHNISAIVAMSDHGGSSGLLRDELGVLPPGDIRQCLVALSSAREHLRQLFTHRFSSGTLKGHTLGNLFLAAFEDMAGDFEKAIEAASEVLQLKGRVIPVTLQKTELYARLKNNAVLSGEPSITKSLALQKAGIKRLYLKPYAKSNPRAIEAILDADLFVMAPGNLYASLVPNLLVKEIPDALEKSKARKVYVCNLVTKRGQTEGFAAHHFADELERWAGRPLFDVIIYNTQAPPEDVASRYRKEGELVYFDKEKAKEYKRIKFIGAPLLSRAFYVPQDQDPLATQRSFIRHDPQKLAAVLLKLLNEPPFRFW